MKIAVLPGALARREGGVESLAQSIDRSLEARGALIVVAGPAFHVITSHPRSSATVSALRGAVARHGDDGLAAQLLDAVKSVANVDPGAGEDLKATATNEDTATPIPDPNDFLDDIKQAFRLGVLIVAGAIALPFVLVALFFLFRVRRHAARERDLLESGEQAARRALTSLGDGIRSLDIDTSMPNADPDGLAAYEQALTSYDQANELLTRSPPAHRVEQARVTIAAGERQIEAARRLLGG